jgi:hypothetical protein
VDTPPPARTLVAGLGAESVEGLAVRADAFDLMAGDEDIKRRFHTRRSTTGSRW